jgi:hypothetical protein
LVRALCFFSISGAIHQLKVGGARGENELISRRAAIWLLSLIAAVTAVIAFLLPPIPQPQWYHTFADQRGLLGVPNFNDVVSNLPFAVIGIWGLALLLRSNRGGPTHFLDKRERWPYLIVFAGLFFTAFGSAYYHLRPSNARLVWDRVPMVIVFMSLLAAIIAERISLRGGLWLLPVLVLIGLGSVWQWHVSELRGSGDLRFYAAVQFYAVLFLLIMFLVPSTYTRSWDLAIVAGFYVFAKILEALDRPIFKLGHVVSGHTLKHLAAACAGYWILRMLRKRRPTAAIRAGSPVPAAAEPPRGSAPRNPERHRPLAPHHRSAIAAGALRKAEPYPGRQCCKGICRRNR